MKRWMLFVFLAVITLTMIGCNNGTGQGGETGQNTTEAATVAVTEPTPVYTKDTLEFNTFADMKKNVSLFKDQMPCTRSTKGYYAVNDNGGATYNITATQPEGIFEKLASGCYAQIVTEADFVIPEQFGAYGDGKKNDALAMNRAAEYAKNNQLTLKLLEKDYKIGATLIWDSIDVKSENAKLSYSDMKKNTPAISVKSNVNVYGKLKVWTVDNGVLNSGDRSALVFGNYGTGEGVHHCYVEDVEITGGCKNGNGIMITGDSSDITLEKVTIPKGTKICRGILLHWGNSNDYVIDPSDISKGIQVAENSKPTAHPHDVHVGTLICEDIDIKGEYGDSAAFFISSAYNVTVDEIIVNSARACFTITPGDCGFLYAPEEVKAGGLKNIKVGKIQATNITTWGVSSQTISGFLGDTRCYSELELGEVDISVKSAGFGLQFYGISKLRVGTLTLRDMSARALYFNLHSGDVEIDTVNMINFKGQLLAAVQMNDEEKCSNVRIKTVNAGENCGDSTKELIYADWINGLTIDTLNLTGASYKAIVSLNANAENIHLGNVVCTNSQIASVFYARNEIPESNNLTLGAISDSSIPLTAGASCTVKVGETA